MWKHIFENRILSEFIKQNSHQGLDRDYYFWRDSNGHEIDLLFQSGEGLHIYEIKASSTIHQRMFDGIDYFSKIADEPIEKKTLVYSGEKKSTARNRKWCLGWKSADLQFRITC
jgi:predicted AAA+ superfamily ATPase